MINGFMIQGGCFEPGMNQKATKEAIKNEANNGLKNTRGTLAMARTQAPHSATAQFFINVADNDFLNFSGESLQGWGYCVFAEVVEGMDVVDKIKAVATGRSGMHQDVPKEDVVITSVTVSEYLVATLFIADLHLQTEEPAITAGFLRFLRGEAKSADALYILGDLFEAWIGDDDPNPLHSEMAAAIHALVDSGVPCYFIHGNRDFLIGKRYARESGMTLLPEERVLNLYGRKVLIMHGDTLCTDDTGYLAFRAKVHTPWIQKVFLALPLFIRNRIAARMRAGSKAANSSKSMTIMDVNPQAVVSVMEKHGVQWLIHGHTHRPDVHSLIANGEPAHRVVLGAWHTEGSMVKVTPEGVELIAFPF